MSIELDFEYIKPGMPLGEVIKKAPNKYVKKILGVIIDQAVDIQMEYGVPTEIAINISIRMFKENFEKAVNAEYERVYGSSDIL